MNRNATAFLLVFGAVALLAMGRSAHAQTYFPSDATINYRIDGNAFVGLDSNGVPSSPTIHITAGAEITGGLRASNASVVNMSGGVTDAAIDAQDSSTLNLTGGSAPTIRAAGASIVNVYGGSFATFEVDPASFFNFYGTGLTATLTGDINDSFVYSLTGALSDGTILRNATLTVNDDNPQNVYFALHNGVAAAAPEPGPASLLVCAGLILGAGRTFRRRASLFFHTAQGTGTHS